MRIFHGVIEIAGQMGILSGELKRRGHIAVGYNIFHSYLGYQNHLINTIYPEIGNQSRHLIHFFDLFHFHYSSTILPEYADLPRLKGLGKKMVMNHWGNDVRFHDQARRNNPYVYTGDSPSNETIHKQLASISRYIREAIVQDYEVYAYVAPYYEKVHVLPIALDMRGLAPHYPDPSNICPLILHAPTNPEFKGTKIIEAALDRLKQEGYSFAYRRIERMNHQAALAEYEKADIVIDQVLCGSYGLFSAEAMALGKPVVAYIREDLVSQFPADLPVVNANPDTLYGKVKELLEQPALRLRLGMRGRAYADRVHRVENVVDRLLVIYGELNS
ncbi:glycosyltransferase [Thermicanus aegyptius]|uniref:glycosyltransferase n=1 Tax=Thermicanus aegyptius TaxID=94009 RepID=UPI0003F5D38C|nr:glycosyltransferase [Thermicanus aegyptius]